MTNSVPDDSGTRPAAQGAGRKPFVSLVLAGLMLAWPVGCTSPRALRHAPAGHTLTTTHPDRPCHALDVDLAGPHVVLDPVLYGWLRRLEGAVQGGEGVVADGCLEPDEVTTLARLGLTDAAGVEFVRAQDAWVLRRWRSLTPVLREPLVAGLVRARAGEFAEARRLWETAQEEARGWSERVLLLEHLVWLDLFAGSEPSLEADIDRLTQAEANSPIARYALAWAAFRTRDLRSSYELASDLRDDPGSPPALRLLAGDLADLVTWVDPELPDDHFELPGGFTRRELMAYARYQNLRVLSSVHELDPVLRDVDVRSFRAVKKRLVRLVSDGGLRPAQVPWVVHLLFNDPERMRYEYRPGLVEPDVAFREGEFDCAEYTHASQELLEAVGLDTGRLLYQASDDLKHTLLVYRVDGRWGFMSVRSFSPPVYPSPSGAWEFWEPYSVSGSLRYTIR